MVRIRLNADPDPFLYFDYQVVGANVGSVRLSAHLGSINQSGHYQQIDDAIDDLGLIGLLTDRDVARPPMKVKQAFSRFYQLAHCSRPDTEAKLADADVISITISGGESAVNSGAGAGTPRFPGRRS